MSLEPEIIQFEAKLLVGKMVITSLLENRTFELWQGFMARRNEIPNRIENTYYSVQLYDNVYFTNFYLNNKFEKWACIEVLEAQNIPPDMNVMKIPSGLYAVFHYIGLPSNSAVFEYIFATWLPNSKYLLDQRPHFEILGEKFDKNSPNSEELICIPIKSKLNL